MLGKLCFYCIPCAKLHPGIMPAGNETEMLAGYNGAVSLLRQTHIVTTNRLSRTKTVSHHCRKASLQLTSRAMQGNGQSWLFGSMINMAIRLLKGLSLACSSCMLQDPVSCRLTSLHRTRARSSSSKCMRSLEGLALSTAPHQQHNIVKDKTCRKIAILQCS